MGAGVGYYPPRKELPPHDRPAPCAEDGVPVPTTGNSLAGVLPFSGAGWWSIGRTELGPYKLSIPDRCNIGVLYTNGYSMYHIANIYGVSYNAIRYILNKTNIARRRVGPYRQYSIDETSFEHDSEVRDYLVGFLMADGNVYKDNDSNCKTISLEIQMEDVYVLERLREFLKTNAPITYHTRKHRDTKTCRLRIHSNAIADSLQRFGVTEAKSLTATAQSGIENSRHFWRGCIDGDGSLTHKGNTPVIKLVGSKNIINQFHRFVIGIIPAFRGLPSVLENIWTLSITGSFTQKLAHVLYTNCNIALPRKQDIAKKFICMNLASRHSTSAVITIDGGQSYLVKFFGRRDYSKLYKLALHENKVINIILQPVSA